MARPRDTGGDFASLGGLLSRDKIAEMARKHGVSPTSSAEPASLHDRLRNAYSGKPVCPQCHAPIRPDSHGWLRTGAFGDVATPVPGQPHAGLIPCPSCSGDVMQRRRYERLSRLMDQSQLPSEWRDWSFQTFPVDAEKREAMELVAGFARGDARPELRLLHIYGPRGVGKTGLAVCVVRAFLERLEAALFWTVPDLLTRIKATYAGDGESEDALIRALVDVDLLVLDDVGAEKASEWQREKLYQVLNGRMAAGRETVLTSNGQPDDLRAILGERILERLEYRCLPVELGGRNLRRPLAMVKGGLA